jgi:hypothetical protein
MNCIRLVVAAEVEDEAAADEASVDEASVDEASVDEAAADKALLDGVELVTELAAAVEEA